MHAVRRGIAAALGLLVVAAFVPGVSHGDAPTRIMLVGDSITAGGTGDWTWRYRLANNLSEAGADFDFVGPHNQLGVHQGGGDEYIDPDFDRDHAAGGGRKWRALSASSDAGLATVDHYDPDVVVVMLGVNDLVYDWTPAADLRDMAKDYILALRASHPQLDFVLGEATPIAWADVSSTNEKFAELADELSTAESRVVLARTSVGYVVDADTYDLVHPAASGEVKIAAAMADALAQLGIGAPATRPLPVVPQGPRIAPELSVSWGEDSATDLVEAQLSWVPHGADGAYVWVRSGGSISWRRMSDQYAASEAIVRLDPAQAHQIYLQPVRGRTVAADDVRSNIVSLPALRAPESSPEPSPDPSPDPSPESTVMIAPTPSATPTEQPAMGTIVAKPGRVTRVRARVEASGRVAVTWGRAPRATTYRLVARRGDSRRWLRFPGSIERRRVIGPLMPGRYAVRVLAINDAGRVLGKARWFRVS